MASKSVFENNNNNQINLFDEKIENSLDIIPRNLKDWEFEEKLSKEFESIGFFISDHPISEFKHLFDIYKIKNFRDFLDSKSNQSVLAATIMKIQEKKTKEGNRFAIIKFSDLGGIFELFIFSEMLESKKDFLKEGKSLLITVLKDNSNQENRFRRITVVNLANLNESISQNISKVTFQLEKLENLEKFSNLISEKGNTDVKVVILNKTKNLTFKLKERRKIDPKILKLLKNEPFLKKIEL